MELRPSRSLAALLPALNTVRHYSASKFRRDLVAGLTVSVVELPQAMAYAIIAGVPPQYGIYTSVIQGIVGALLSSSNHVTTGPTNTQSLLIASAVTRALGSDLPPHLAGPLYLQMVICLSLMKGVLQLFFAAARLGELLQFVSRSVIIGVAVGAGALIIVGQLPHLLGVTSYRISTLPGVVGQAEDLWRVIGGIDWRTLTIGAAAVLIMLVGKSFGRMFPSALTAVIATTVLTVVMGWNGQVSQVGQLPAGFPMPGLPIVTWQDIQTLLPGALALALLGAIETVAIAKTLAARSGDQINANHEFFAQGAANLAGSFFSCFPGSASFTRSALDHDAGAATRFAGVFNALIVATLFLAFGHYAAMIPLASLAAVLMVVAVGLIDLRSIFRIARADRSDAIVCVVTILATMLLPLEYAIFTGIFLNIAFYLRTSSRLHIAEVVQTDTGGFIERPIYDREGTKKIMFIQLEGELYFAIADQLRDQLAALRRSGVRVIIIRLKQCHSIDATVLHVLEEFAGDMRRHNGHILLCGVRPEVMKTIRAYGLDTTIGNANLFDSHTGVFTSAKKALIRARELVGGSIDASNIRIDEEGEITYDI